LNSKTLDEKLVLVVDDGQYVRKGVFRLSRMEGYSVLEAENGQKALEVLENAQSLPCVILLDLLMPVMDGHEFLRLRSADPVSREISVVVVSGTLPSEPLPRTRAYLQKPVTVDHLMAVVGHHC
jgi:CheY-like chemotaxis protein